MRHVVRSVALSFAPLAVPLLLAVGCGPKTTPVVDVAGSGAIASSASAGDAAVVGPVRRTLKWSVEQPGTIRPYEEAPLAVRISGYVAKVHADIGDRVFGPGQVGWFGNPRDGTLLAELSVPEMQEDLNRRESLVTQAESEIELARKNLELTRAGEKSAEALVREAEAGVSRANATFDRWKAESVRVDDLAVRKVIDRQTADETRNQYKAAEAGLAEVGAKIDSAKAILAENRARVGKAGVEIVTAQAKLKVAQAERNSAKVMRDYGEIRAPFDGVVTARYIHRGHFVQPASSGGMNGGGGRSEPVFTIARLDPVRVFVEVPEMVADRIPVGGEASIRIPALRGADVPGKVARTSWTLGGESRTLRTEVDLPNPDGRIRPGMYAFARIPVEVTQALTIPAAATVMQDESPWAWCVEEGKAMRYQLQAGQRDKEGVEVLARRRSGGPWVPVGESMRFFAVYPSGVTDGQDWPPRRQP